MQQDINFIKAQANIAEEFLQSRKISGVKHTDVLELLARLNGYRNWSTFREQLAVTPAVSNPPTLQQALTMCYRWMASAPLEELEAVESALGENAPMAMAAEALKAVAPEPTKAATRPKAPSTRWSPAMGPMTDEQFLARHAQHCPSCGSTNLRGDGRPDTENGTAWQSIKCEDCDARWNEQYKMTGYDYLEGGLDHETIESVVDDIKDRAKKYEFSFSNEEQARELISETCDLYGYALREIEIEQAVKQLVS